jgi:hypothetical protein
VKAEKKKRLAALKRHLQLRWAGIRKRMQRFSGLISFSGVAVILATFIIKDVLLDEEKDAVGAFESAQHDFNITASTARLYTEAERIRIGTEQIYAKILQAQASATSNLPDQEDFTVALQSVQGTAFQSAVELATPIKVLLEALPEDLPLKEHYDHLTSQIQIYQNYQNQISYLTKTLLDPKARTEEWWVINRVDLLLAASRSHEMQREIQNDLIEIEDQVLKEFQSKSQDAKVRLKLFTNASYVLFVIGFVIGLAGQIVGVKTSGAE